MRRGIYRLDKALSLSGYFRNVDAEDGREVAANLTYDRTNGIVLDLLERLPNANAPTFSLLHRLIPTIVGKTKDDEHVLLLKSFTKSSSLSMITGEGHETYGAHMLLISDRPISSLDSTKFDFSFAGLELWLGEHFVSFKASNVAETGIYAILEIAAHEEQVDQVPHIAARVETDSHISLPSPGYTSFTVQNTALMVIIPTEKKGLDWFIEYGRRLRNLACLCLGMYLPMRFSRSLNVVENFEGTPVSHWNSVIYMQLQDADWKEDSLPIFPVFNLMMLRSLQQDFLNRWFELYDKAKAALDLFFAVQRGNTPYTDGRFLSYIQALETHSRLTTPSTSFDKNQFQQLRKKVIAGLPDEVNNDMKERIIAGLKMSYEISLRQRLKNSVARAAVVFGSNPLGLTDNICSRIVATRNYLTHAGIKSSEVFEVTEMTDIYKRVGVLLATLIFLDIGINADDIKSRIENNSASFWQYNR